MWERKRKREREIEYKVRNRITKALRTIVEEDRDKLRENKVEQNEIVIPTYNNTSTKQRSDFTLYGK